MKNSNKAFVHIRLYVSKSSSDILFLYKIALVFSGVLLLSFLSVLHCLWQCARVCVPGTHTHLCHFLCFARWVRS